MRKVATDYRVVRINIFISFKRKKELQQVEIKKNGCVYVQQIYLYT